jgi:competence protein ComEA
VRPRAAVGCLIFPGLLFLARPSPAYAGKSVDGVVNLNTAPAEILALLPGIGPAKAEAILVYRKRRPFRTVDELVRIKGVGRKMVRRLRMHLAVAGPTTASGTVAKPGVTPVTEQPPPAPPAHPPRAAGNPPGRTIAHLAPSTHPACPPPVHPHVAGRVSVRDRSPARPWRAPCLGPP